MGSYNLKDGNVSELIAPTISYVGNESTALCEVNKCTIFEGTGFGIRFVRNGSINMNGKTCHYTDVEWHLDGSKDLVQKYILDDVGPHCKEQGVIERTLVRVQR